MSHARQSIGWSNIPTPMKKNFVVLEKWRKGGFTNRLVTDGQKIQLQYWSAFWGGWRVDQIPSNRDKFLKVFK